MLNRWSLVGTLGMVVGSAGLAACAGDRIEADDGTATVASELSKDDRREAKEACRTSRRLQRMARGRSLGDDYDGEDDADAHATDAIRRGRHHFNDRRLRGLGANGRACADCHQAHDAYSLSPSTAKARFDALQKCRSIEPDADDPLFRAIDADDFRVNGANASDFSNLVENGLVRVTLPLPGNVKLLDPVTLLPTGETEADVWRAVPTVHNVAITGSNGIAPFGPRGPNTSGGYQIDARFGTLQEQALGALTAHAQITSQPAPRMLDDLAAFQNDLFSSAGVRAIAGALQAGTTPPDIDPPLTALETEGKAVFERACGNCHGGASQSNTIQQNLPPFAVLARFHNPRAGCPRNKDTAATPRWAFDPCPSRLERNARTYEVTNADGSKSRIRTNDPGRMLLTGNFADAETFDVPQLRNLAATAPYFHNNSVDTIEGVVILYEEFYKRVLAVAPTSGTLTTDGINRDRPNTAADRDALVAYLRKL